MTSTVDDIPKLQDSRGYRSVSLHFPAVMRFLSDRNVGSFSHPGFTCCTKRSILTRRGRGWGWGGRDTNQDTFRLDFVCQN